MLVHEYYYWAGWNMSNRRRLETRGNSDRVWTVTVRPPGRPLIHAMGTNEFSGPYPTRAMGFSVSSRIAFALQKALSDIQQESQIPSLSIIISILGQ